MSLKQSDKDNLREYYLENRNLPNKMLRERLMIENPHCHYCGIKVVSYPDLYTRDLKKGEYAPDDMATIEHLYDRFDPRRYTIFKNGSGRVLACYKCNHKRAEERTHELTQDFLRKRALEGAKKPKGVIRALYFSTVAQSKET